MVRVHKEDTTMIFGTHNSATGGKLLWWLRPIGGIINLTSKCQNKTIADQLADGVKLFNLQVAYVGGKWRFTHGLAIYKEEVIETIARMKACATKEKPIYFQLYLDKCFWCKQDESAFAQLIADIEKKFCCWNFVMLYAWVEGTDTYYDGTDCYPFPKWEEHYWTTSWAENNAKSWLDKIPLPKRHARKYNSKYSNECKTEYLMLDYYNI